MPFRPELIKKISHQISTASFLIAGITGSNANVFFELGIAHATGQPVIFLTQDALKDAPRNWSAVRNVLVSSLDVTLMFETARDLVKQFNLDSVFTHDRSIGAGWPTGSKASGIVAKPPAPPKGI
ncbi:MAG TPA: hypothetical protein VNY05_35315 [Candidatus Acidoferrales bacterium]|jgi:hypothetical protein|nr:hypothetical protein [Candidatus Acidoferrales bacterium]